MAVEVLHGEMDIEELLILCILRVIAPEVESIIIRRIVQLRNAYHVDINDEKLRRERTNFLTEFQNDIDSILAGSNASRGHQPHIRSLIAILLPYLQLDNRNARKLNPQSILQFLPIDYLSRYLHRTTSEVSDQQLLRWLDDLRQKNNAEKQRTAILDFFCAMKSEVDGADFTTDAPLRNSLLERISAFKVFAGRDTLELLARLCTGINEVLEADNDENPTPWQQALGYGSRQLAIVAAELPRVNPFAIPPAAPVRPLDYITA